MNERIYELAKQAEKSVQFLSNSAESKQRIIMKKFAELIVQECIDYCGENLSKTVGHALKIHLGVE